MAETGHKWWVNGEQLMTSFIIKSVTNSQYQAYIFLYLYAQVTKSVHVLVEKSDALNVVQVSYM